VFAIFPYVVIANFFQFPLLGESLRGGFTQSAISLLSFFGEILVGQKLHISVLLTHDLGTVAVPPASPFVFLK